MVIAMNSISVRFYTNVYDEGEVITLYYHANGVFGCKFFTETYNTRTGEVHSALNNMMKFVYRLMGCGIDDTERFYRKH